MLRRLLCALALAACTSASPTSTGTASPDTFIGSWQAITPGREFIGLTIASLSIRPGALGARLTFSGVAWDGNGSIDQDAFRATMGISGNPTTTRTLVVRSTRPDTLEAQFGSGDTAETLTLVRGK